MKTIPLSKKKDFNSLFSKGKRIFKSHLTVIYFFLTDTKESSCLKIAYIVSKKISPKAVVRNKIKRRLRAATRQIITELALQDKISDRTLFIAILPYKKILDVSFQQIYLEVEQALKKIMQ